MQRAVKLLVSLMAAVALLACTGPFLVECIVQTFSHFSAPPATPATYRFDRLPSQQVPEQARLEALAGVALQQAGFRRDDGNARYSVVINARSARVLSPWADPLGGWGWGPHHATFGYWSAWDRPWYQRQVSVVMRDLRTSDVVYETHAFNDGPLVDDWTAFSAMFQAAMHGFPAPPSGPRRVEIQIPG